MMELLLGRKWNEGFAPYPSDILPTPEDCQVEHVDRSETHFVFTSFLLGLVYFKPEWMYPIRVWMRGERYNESEKLKSGNEPVCETDKTL